MLDTADMPSSYGSPIWMAGGRAGLTSAPVFMDRATGGVVIGKDRDDRIRDAQTRPDRQSGEPAAHTWRIVLARRRAWQDGMFGGVRNGRRRAVTAWPAAYCGVVGYMPSFGMISRNGMKIGVRQPGHGRG